ncbi:RNA polymerase sigma factor [Flavobacterium sp. HSC-61S13]|uniref:RNA polymerase sigma factor n=1 Tax=Flavobacterium sp. HSC-61S13 TaxID=2910963 RepID=UPI0020A1529E|nr:sigma-70 family RNA polymerase sigma factor [Flavobacterium sp. HSC-61S13]MCP1996742.1 RNA polymerase sigma-70 factor (ECF subfamily) [Flavobacterium sp. HSC-61S13]
MELDSIGHINIEDEELVALVIETGDTSYFGILYDRYSNLVYNKCRSFSGSDAMAQDLTHDIFIQLFVKLDTFKGNSKFSTWLFSFTYNHCVNFYNRDLKKKNLETDLIDEYNYSIPVGETDIADEEILAMNAEKLQRALKIAEPEEKVVLLMKYQDDLSIKTIAEQVGIGESAVKMRLHRAKKRVLEIYNSL